MRFFMKKVLTLEEADPAALQVFRVIAACSVDSSLCQGKHGSFYLLIIIGASLNFRHLPAD